MTASPEQSWHAPVAPLPEIPPPAQAITALPNLTLVAERAQRISNCLVPDEHDAAEIVQKAMVGIWQRYINNGPPNKPEAYLNTVVRNGVASHGRRAQYVTSHEASLDEIVDFGEDAIFPLMLSDPASSLPEQVIASETLDEVLGYWPLLTEQQRSYLLMSMEGHQPAEIAAQFGVRANQVSACLSRARQTLKKLLHLSTFEVDELAEIINDGRLDPADIRLYRRKEQLDKERSAKY